LDGQIKSIWRLGHIDHIFVHQLQDERFIFVALTVFKPSPNDRDEVLDLPYVREVGHTIVGINTIRSERKYIVALEDPEGHSVEEPKTVLVHWNVGWL
jgi:hypothetical protein